MVSTLLLIVLLILQAESGRNSFGRRTKIAEGAELAAVALESPHSPIRDPPASENARLREESNGWKSRFEEIDCESHQLRQKLREKDAQIEKMKVQARAKGLPLSSTRVELQAAKQAVKDRNSRIFYLEDRFRKHHALIYEFEKNERNLISIIESLKCQKRESRSVEEEPQNKALLEESDKKSLGVAALEKKLEDKQSLLDQLQTGRGLFVSDGNVRVVLSEWAALVIVGCTGLFFVIMLVIWYKHKCSKKTKPSNLAQQFFEAQKEVASKAVNVSVIGKPFISDAQNIRIGKNAALIMKKERQGSIFSDEDKYNGALGFQGEKRLAQMI